jgi:hypothetical protein
VDVKVAGVSILSTKPQIQSGEFSSLTGTEAVLSSTTFSKGDKVTIHIDQIGSTVAGTGLKVSFVWVRT